jgi:hypothetical protein
MPLKVSLAHNTSGDDEYAVTYPNKEQGLLSFGLQVVATESVIWKTPFFRNLGLLWRAAHEVGHMMLTTLFSLLYGGRYFHPMSEYLMTRFWLSVEVVEIVSVENLFT